MSAVLSGVVAVPLAGAVGTLVCGRRLAPRIGGATSVVTLLLAAMVARDVRSGGTVSVEVGGWSAPLGIVMRADGLAAAMLLLAAVVGVAVTAAAAEFGADRGSWVRADGFWPLWLLLWAAVAALVVSRDVFNVYVALELVSLSAVGLVALGGGRAALEGALRYLLAAWLGATAYLLGVALVYADVGTLDMVGMSGRIGEGAAPTAALALMTVGLLLKAAVVPLHFWLPRAHASAPAPVSAALSGLVVTGALVVLARLWSEAMAGAVTAAAGTLVGVIGVVAIGWGSVLALRQRRLKMLIAYSTVGQVGYLLLLVPLAAAPLAAGGSGDRATTDAWVGGTYYAFTHGIAKASLFLAAGCLVWAAGTDRISAMGGMAARLPVVVTAFVIAGVTLIGLPPTGGFVAKWYLVSASIRSGEPWWAAAVLLGSLLTAAYVLAVVRVLMSRGEVGPAPVPVPWGMQLAAAGLAVVCLALGLRPLEGLELLGVAIPSPGTAGGEPG